MDDGQIKTWVAAIFECQRRARAFPYFPINLQLGGPYIDSHSFCDIHKLTTIHAFMEYHKFQEVVI